jgi:hypothetical protein
MLGKIVVLIVSLVLFVATEMFFPVDGTDARAVKEKHFWATILFVFSIVLGLPIEISMEIQKEVTTVRAELEKHEQDASLHGGFENLFVQYKSNFGDAKPPLDHWAEQLLSYLTNSFTTGEIPLPLEQVAGQIALVYSTATWGIVATNVGSTDTYFNDRNYLDANKNTSERGVPVVRFYLYDDDHRVHIRMRDGKIPSNIDAYCDEVKQLHSQMKSLYSAVIDVQKLEHLDLLIMDNRFVAQTEISPDWEPRRGLASQNRNRLYAAREYFRQLRGAIDDRHVYHLDDAQVKAKYGKNPNLPKDTLRTAESLVQYLLDRMANPSIAGAADR